MLEKKLRVFFFFFYLLLEGGWLDLNPAFLDFGCGKMWEKDGKFMMGKGF